MNIRTILDIEKWQGIQDKLALVTGMAMITVDYKGEPVTRHSGCSEFCMAIRTNSKMSKWCERCDARGGFEAARINDVYIYRCHADLVDAAVPITVGDKYIGAVMLGQVIIEDSDGKEQKYLEKIYSAPIGTPYDNDKAIGYLDLIPRMSYEKINNIARLIYSISNYIVEDAIEKHYLNKGIHIDDKEKGLTSGLSQQENNDSILKPAIDYIHQNLNQNLYLKQAANMCFISPSYFSRLFAKEMGSTFSSYVANVKMDKAKELLKTTDMLIKEIAQELGFNDQSYFIKQFKINEGVTPAHFRRKATENIKSHTIIR